MDADRVKTWQQDHDFNREKRDIETRTLIVVIITLATMILEIVFGFLTNSMALLADGWHMGTHALALGISLAAYVLARKYAGDYRFAFGAWKIEILGAYTSAVVLGIAGLFLVFTSLERMFNPVGINYTQAILVAVIGLAVNALSAVILNKDDQHPNGNDHHTYGHQHHQKDLNQQSAFFHVVADAVTSLLAIVALLGAKYLNARWLDPFMGIVGAFLILRWSALLLKDTSRILLLREMDSPIVEKIRKIIEADGDTKVADLHVWRVAQDKFACILTLVTEKDRSVDEYKSRIKNINELAHVTIEIHRRPTEKYRL